MTAEDSQKALLALDGGGMRGAFTLGRARRDWSRCSRKKTGRGEGFVLADFFDYIGGTSTGAIIATGLSLGWSVIQAQGPVPRSRAKVFRNASSSRCGSGRSIRESRSTIELKRAFGDRTFGDPDLRTLLMIVMHNRSTDSPYPLSNNPKAPVQHRRVADAEQPEPAAVRSASASTAAPAFFPPVPARLRRRGPGVRRRRRHGAQQSRPPTVPGRDASGVPAGVADRARPTVARSRSARVSHPPG